MRRGATLDPRTARCLEIPLVSLMQSVATLEPGILRATTPSGDPNIIPGVATPDPRTARAAARLLLRLLGAGYSDYLATSATHPPPSEERYTPARLLPTRVYTCLLSSSPCLVFTCLGTRRPGCCSHVSLVTM